MPRHKSPGSHLPPAEDFPRRSTRRVSESERPDSTASESSSLAIRVSDFSPGGPSRHSASRRHRHSGSHDQQQYSSPKPGNYYIAPEVLRVLLHVDMAAEAAAMREAYTSGANRPMSTHRKIQYALRQDKVGDLFLDNVSRVIIFCDQAEPGFFAGEYSDMSPYAVAISRWARERGHAHCFPFLCGPSRKRDEDRGARSDLLANIMRSLCYQILDTSIMTDYSYIIHPN